MSKVISTGYVDSGATATTLPRGPLNFGDNFRVSKDTGSSLLLVNITGPLDRNENIKYEITPIANIYDKTGIDASVFAPNKRGNNIYVKISDIFQVTDTDDASFVQQLPLSASLTIRCIQSEYITADHVQAIIGRLISALYDTGLSTTTRLNAILRGSLKPSDL